MAVQQSASLPSSFSILQGHETWDSVQSDDKESKEDPENTDGSGREQVQTDERHDTQGGSVEIQVGCMRLVVVWHREREREMIISRASIDKTV